ncbi:hypothetical protein RSOLAG1IB_08981 [Rhizoctonia solani AG-1 IB]|uniref:RING-type domain-containing protein n=1 Tax=Thanatephorus cucumeris (strain AG1-IB / isolate 7/3/14) TaxID=1108050 RepID=A0A0B7FRX6_THACB|nr:hypothetical protein RSOLAG1IB_08981 [Rhizoctonia solani AG-1 IB]
MLSPQRSCRRPSPISQSLDYIDYDSFLPDFEDLLEDAGADSPPEKRKSTPSDMDDFEEQGPLLSEYMCPICYSPPQNAVVTLCGHILCGSCLYSATTTRQAACQPACPVCRTPIPNLQFTSMSIATRLNPNRNLPLNVMNQYQPRSTIAGYDGAEDKWDPARSGVIGLEIMTTGDA